MSERTPIESHVAAQIESAEGDLIEYLVGQFPPELHNRLYDEIAEMDEEQSVFHLSTKLINRRFALSIKGSEMLASEGVEVIHEYPYAILQHIEHSQSFALDNRLGNGNNGEVIASINQPGTCYKVLFLERAREIAATAAREALLQHQAGKVLGGQPGVARVPSVLRYVDNKDLRAIQMEQIDGASIKKILSGEVVLPQNFDIDIFFTELRNAVELLNAAGIFHRDLINNAGNVIVDKEGKPWIIDFGTALRAANFDQDTGTYQLLPGGSWTRSHDIAGVTKMKQELKTFIAKQHA